MFVSSFIFSSLACSCSVVRETLHARCGFDPYISVRCDECQAGPTASSVILKTRITRRSPSYVRSSRCANCAIVRGCLGTRGQQISRRFFNLAEHLAFASMRRTTISASRLRIPLENRNPSFCLALATGSNIARRSRICRR